MNRDVAPLFQNGSDKFQRLGRLMFDHRLEQADRDAAELGFLALQYVMRPEIVWEFNAYLRDWPPKSAS